MLESIAVRFALDMVRTHDCGGPMIRPASSRLSGASLGAAAGAQPIRTDVKARIKSRMPLRFQMVAGTILVDSPRRVEDFQFAATDALQLASTSVSLAVCIGTLEDSPTQTS